MISVLPSPTGPHVEQVWNMPARVSYPRGSVSAVLLDIEGTTTSISFVHDILFSYAKRNVRHYLLSHENEPNIRQLVQDVKDVAGTPDASLEQVAASTKIHIKILKNDEYDKKSRRSKG